MDLKDSCMIESGTRCRDKAFIVLIGLTGAGKSSTLNSLFGHGVAEEAAAAAANTTPPSSEGLHFSSNTRKILEYSISVPTLDNKEYHELIVIDTPGFGDTDGKQKNAQILASLETYLHSHQELTRNFPTAVFLTVNISDPQLLEEKSYFTSLLQALEMYIQNRTLIDIGHKKCNVVVVLTHFMSINDAHVRQHPDSKKTLMQGIIKTFTSIPANVPVLMAENCAAKYPELQKEKGYCVLPNGDKYPFNLFQAVKEIAIESDDQFGQDIFSDAFSCPYELKKELKDSMELLDVAHPSTMSYLNKLDELKFKIVDTKINLKLQSFWDQLPPAATAQVTASLQIVKSKFQERGIFHPNDIPTRVKDTLNLLSTLPMNEAVQSIVIGVGIRPPSLKEHLASCWVGCFYNIINDKSTSMCPLDMSKEYITDIGFFAPTCFRMTKITDKSSTKVITASMFKTKVDYFKHRLGGLKVSYEKKLHDKFLGNPIPGHNVPSVGMKTLSAIMEIRLFSVSLSDNVEWDEGYISSLTSVAVNDANFKVHVHNFVLTQGSHIVESGLLGGFIEMVAVPKPNMKQVVANDKVLQILKGLLEKIDDNNNNIELPTDLNDRWTLEITFHGGDPTIVKPNFSQLPKPLFSSFYSTWKESLFTHPVVLPNEIRLCHISSYMQYKNFGVSDALSDAAHEILGICKFNTAGQVTAREKVDRSYWSRCYVM